MNDHAAIPSVEGVRAATITVVAVSADPAARLCGVSRGSWRKLHLAGKYPLPVRLERDALRRVDVLRRVLHVLRTRQHIRPSARAGTLRLYERNAIAQVRHELSAIDARQCRRRLGKR